MNVTSTESKVFRRADPGWLKAQLRRSVVVDGRNLFEPREMRTAGIRYYAVGRGDCTPSIQPRSSSCSGARFI